MLPVDSAEKHRTKLGDVQVAHLISKTHAYSRRGLAGIMPTANSWSQLDVACIDLMQPRIIYKGYRFAWENTILRSSIGSIELHGIVCIVRTRRSWCIDCV